MDELEQLIAEYERMWRETPEDAYEDMKNFAVNYNNDDSPSLCEMGAAAMACCIIAQMYEIGKKKAAINAQNN